MQCGPKLTFFFCDQKFRWARTKMADATIVKTRPTNEYWQHCGPQKWDLSKQTEEARQSRIDWLKTLNRTPLPSGPYPFHVAFRGWFKGHIDDERYQACYVLREDLNLDVQIFEVTRSLDGCVTNRVLIEDPKTIIGVRLYMQTRIMGLFQSIVSKRVQTNNCHMGTRRRDGGLLTGSYYA